MNNILMGMIIELEFCGRGKEMHSEDVKFEALIRKVETEES